MLLELFRYPSTEHSTLGELFQDKNFFLYTMELPWKNNEQDVSCIPTGKYRIILRDSAHFKGKVPFLENVPGRKDILMHNGSYPYNTDGCILVGMIQEKDFLGRTVEALGLLRLKIALAISKGEKVWLEIKEK